jgi:hypothetical protein
VETRVFSLTKASRSVVANRWRATVPLNRQSLETHNVPARAHTHSLHSAIRQALCHMRDLARVRLAKFRHATTCENGKHPALEFHSTRHFHQLSEPTC